MYLRFEQLFKPGSRAEHPRLPLLSGDENNLLTEGEKGMWTNAGMLRVDCGTDPSGGSALKSMVQLTITRLKSCLCTQLELSHHLEAGSVLQDGLRTIISTAHGY